MLNQVILVGRVFGDIKVSKTEQGTSTGMLTLAVPRSFKNEEGEYETDIIEVKIIGSIATNTKEFVQTGDIIGIKGRIESKEDKSIQIVAEKVTFLSSKKDDENENN